MDEESSRYATLESVLQDPSSEPQAVPLEYLRNITNDFSDKQLRGEGGFGKVFKGVLPNGKMIAVKKLEQLEPGVQDKQFENEVYHLMKLKHSNIVRFVGYCYETRNECLEYNGKFIFAEMQQRLLCLEYMPNRSLDGHLSDEFSGLDWHTRYRIIKGICCGLHYLHEECKCQINASIIHLDLKPANIWLDEKMVPKVADFGLSRLFEDKKTWTCTSTLAGSFGYMAPEYIYKRIISTTADIYSLGVIIIEIITGIKIDPFSFNIATSGQEFVERVLKNWRNRLEATPSETDCEQINVCLEIGLSCIKMNRDERPTAREIIEMLNRWESTNCYINNESGEARNAQESSARWGPGDSPNLASGLEDANPSYPYIPTVLERPSSSFSEAAEDDSLPGIEGLQITGEAFPGHEVIVSGYPTNGTSTCYFQWVRHLEYGSVDLRQLEDGPVKPIEGATMPSYVITADDVGTLLAVEVRPLDDSRERKGNVFKIYANERRKISCDPETKELIKRTLEIGHVAYEVQIQQPQVRFLDLALWEPGVLAINSEGYTIKCNGQHGFVITEKFQQATVIHIPYGYPTEFSIISGNDADYNLKLEENTLLRDTIVLVLRFFKSNAVERRGIKKGLAPAHFMKTAQIRSWSF